MGVRGPVMAAIIDLDSRDLGVEVLAEQICDACVEGVDIDGAGLSLLTAQPARRMLWATDATAERLEDLQVSLNEGACIDAATSGMPVLVPDLRASTLTARWPVFAASVAEQTGVAALFALPLQWGAVNIGVLDFYRGSPGGLDPVQWRDVLAAADAAAMLLIGHRTQPASSVVDGMGADGMGADGMAADVDGWFRVGTFSRVEIHQATGMVMGQLGIGSEDALARMRAHAFSAQLLLVDVAGEVVARRLSFTEEMR